MKLTTKSLPRHAPGLALVLALLLAGCATGDLAAHEPAAGVAQADHASHSDHPSHAGHGEGHGHHAGHEGHERHAGHGHAERHAHHAGHAPCADAAVPDLATVKARLVDYHDSGRYAADQAAAVAKARAYLAEHLDPAKKQAIVFDVDETALSNWPAIVGINFGYERENWGRWVERAEALAIAPTLELFEFARENGVDVFFITGRREKYRDATARNLEAIGYGGFKELILKPDDFDIPFAAVYKAAARKRIVEQGYDVVLTLGDQQSDLDGGFADAAFKMPNPFYRVP